MSKLQTLGLASALAIAGAVLAQTPSPSTTTNPEARTPDTQTPESQTSTSQGEDTMGQEPSTTQPSTTQSPTGTPPISDSDPSGTADTYPSSSEDDQASAENESTRIAAADMSKDKHRVSKLIGKNVETSTGDTIGEVKDVVIDDKAKITHFIVSHGRLGSTKLTAIPYETLKQSMRGDKIVLEKTRLENAPSFEESNFPNLSSSTWSSAADRYWGRSRTASADMSSSSSSSGSMSSESSSSPSSSSSSESGSTGSTGTSEDPSEDPDSSETVPPTSQRPY
jgi:sporulation protein YlmC with PRC-barrel domain